MIDRLTSLLNKCSSWSQLNQIHALLTTSGLSKTHPYASKLLSFAATSPSPDISYAHRFFLQIPSPSLAHYNSLIRGFSHTKTPIKCLHIFLQMLLRGVAPDYLTFPFLVKASALLSNPNLGGFIHGHVLKRGLSSDLFISNSLVHMYGSLNEIDCARKVFDEMSVRNLVSWNSMLDGYGKCGNPVMMREVFDEMPERNVVSWSALIDGYVKHGDYSQALSLFRRMKIDGPSANEVTMVSVLCACSHLGALDEGRKTHRYIVDNALPLTLVLRTSLVDMYAKCGSIDDALLVFREASNMKTDVLIWNAVIGGLATHGYTSKAVGLYTEMLSLRIKPDEITYLCLLTACAHKGLVDEAWKYFDYLKKDGLVPKSEHYACMVDVLARAGRVREAYRFISEMPIEPSASTLGALLNGCVNHRRLDLAQVVGKRLVEMDPGHDGRYVGLSNVYAVGKRWDEARSAREAMESRGVKKLAGYSYVEICGSLHKFVAHDKVHLQSQEIYVMLSVIRQDMKHSVVYI